MAAAILAVTIIGVVATLVWRGIAIEAQKELGAGLQELDELREELGFERERGIQLKAERDMAVKAINSYYLASFHSGSEEVEAWMQRVYDELNGHLVGGGGK